MLTALAERTLAGIIVTAADQHIRFANAYARNVLGRSTDLRIEDRRLTLAPKVARAFAAGLAAAVADEPRATRLSLHVDGADPRNVFIAPLSSAWNMAEEDQRLALIVLGGARSAEILPNARDLRQYFDLTPAESNVALLLCAGLIPKGIARKLNVSLPTVRSHLRALLDKTGTAPASRIGESSFVLAEYDRHAFALTLHLRTIRRLRHPLIAAPSDRRTLSPCTLVTEMGIAVTSRKRACSILRNV